MSEPLVSIIMGSQSDWETMQTATTVLTELGIPFEARVVSAHRTPSRLVEFAEGAAGRGIQVIIAGAGGAAQYGREEWGGKGVPKPPSAALGGAKTNPPTAERRTDLTPPPAFMGELKSTD